MQEILREQTAEIIVIDRAVSVAVNNLRLHVTNLQAKFGDTRNWAQETIRDQRAALNDWQHALEILSGIPAQEQFSFLLRRPSTPTKGGKQATLGQGTLRAFINTLEVNDAAGQASQSSVAFGQKVADVEDALQGISADTGTAVEEIESNRLEPFSDEYITQLFEESETFAKKITSDYEHILRLPNNPKSIASTSRMALGHTREFLPSLKAVAQEIGDHVIKAIQDRNVAVRSALLAMQNISVLESNLAHLSSQIQSLDLDPEGLDAFDTLEVVFRLPTAYGSVLVEAFRRAEWEERVKADSASLAEEMALYRDEEQRRRRKWVKSMTPFVDETEGNSTTEMEINLRGKSNDWPPVSREDIDTYAQELKKHGIDEAHQDLLKMLQELDTPTKQQKKQARAFKNGSMYDAGLGLGRSSLMLRGDSDARNMKEENSKLSDKLKASESRVRRLEAILHSSSNLGRPLSGTFGTNPSEYDRVGSPMVPPSPRPNDALSRRSSVSSRRMSSNQNPDEKLAARIVSLEAQLLQMQQEARAQRRSSTESRDRIQEAESTKKDLMANLEAQRQEFDDERQLLEDEIHKLKIRLEETEDELDRIMGSRDQDKAFTENAVRDLQTQLDQAQKLAYDERQQAQDEFNALNADLVTHRTRVGTLEKQLQEQTREKSSIQAHNLEMADQLRDAAAAHEEYISSLQAAHSQLSPDGSAPADLSQLVHAIEILSEGLAIHARSADNLAQMVSAENKSLEARLVQAEKEAGSLGDEITSKDSDLLKAEESLQEEKSKLGSLRAELASEQEELQKLREKIDAGETGSNELRDRLSEEQVRASQLRETLAAAEANAKSFEHEIQTWKEKLHKAAEFEKQLKSHLDGRGRRSTELSRRLYAQNDRMIRVMEQMGYSITRQDDQLVIQRASKVNSSSTTLQAPLKMEVSTVATASVVSPSAEASETPATIARSVSGPYAMPHYSDAADLELMYWSDSDATSEGKKFQAFISSISRLDLDAVSELVAKRYKDVETLARKWQRESRAYREKYHRAQSEAHEKIAYRGFKDGDLALFLPTRNQATRPWAAFNVGAPHYFLREHDSHKLQTRDWLLARISKVEERVVDLSRSIQDRRSLQAETSDAGSMRSVDDENPFELSDGLRWYMIDAYEEKPGAPSTPGLGKSTVAATTVDARGSIPLMKDKKKARDSIGSGNAALATKTLSKSLDSRRSSTGSKKGHSAGQSVSSATGVGPVVPEAPATGNASSSGHAAPSGTSKPAPTPAKTGAAQAVAALSDEADAPAREDAPIFEEVRKDLLFGP